MGQENNDNADETVEHIKKVCRNLGWNPIEDSKFLEGIENYYVKPSLIQIVNEELPQILRHDPEFFRKYNINLPERVDVAIFDMYYDKSGVKGVKSATHAAKVYFRHLRFFLIDHPDREQLYETIESFKKILAGNHPGS